MGRDSALRYEFFQIVEIFTALEVNPGTCQRKRFVEFMPCTYDGTL